jgi:hypothetical protein
VVFPLWKNVGVCCASWYPVASHSGKILDFIVSHAILWVSILEKCWILLYVVRSHGFLCWKNVELCCILWNYMVSYPGKTLEFSFSHGILWFSIVKNVEFCCVPCDSMISHSEKMLYFLCLMESYGFLAILCFSTMCRYRKKIQLVISGNEDRYQ